MHFPTPVRKHALGSIVAYINQLFFLDSLASILPGGQSGEVTPVPIPNTEVKSTNGEGTVGVAHGRVARCQAFFIRARTINLVRALSFLSYGLKRDWNAGMLGFRAGGAPSPAPLGGRCWVLGKDRYYR